MNRRTIYLAAATCFLVLQMAVIGSVIVKGNLVITKGVECKFQATGYDPSDPLRGRYVQFAVQIKTTVLDDALDKDAWDQKTYFQLSETPDASGFTQVLRCAATPTEDGLWIGPVKTRIDYSLEWSDPTIDDEKWEDFEKRRRQSPKAAYARLPAKFYVPEKMAPELEKRLREEGASAVAVYRAYKGSILLVDFQVTP